MLHVLKHLDLHDPMLDYLKRLDTERKDGLVKDVVAVLAWNELITEGQELIAYDALVANKDLAARYVVQEGMNIQDLKP